MKKAVEGKKVEVKDKLLAQLRDPARIEVLPDGWFRDKLHGIDRAPLELIKHVDNLEEGIKYAESLNAYVPEDYETESLIDRSRRDPAIIDPFTKIQTDDWFMTKTPVKNNSGLIWCVSFDGGSVGNTGKGSDLYVWPVRSSQ